MVLVNSYARGADYYNSNPLARTLAGIKSLAAADYEFFTLALANAATAFSDAATGKAQARMMRESMSWESAIAYVDGAHAIDIVADLPMVSVHTLVVEDPSGLLTGELNRLLASQIPDATFTRGDYLAELELFVRPARTSSGRPMDLDPSPFRTILFTDLESHTQLMSRLGDDRGREVLREHERRTREALRANGGSEVKSMGDGFMASFGSAQRALECARAIQTAFDDPVAGEALKVRIGVNAGEPVAEDDDLFGTSVIAAARIASKATGGQVLVADVVRQLVAGKGFLVHDTGEHDLKGLEEPVRLWELRLG